MNQRVSLVISSCLVHLVERLAQDCSHSIGALPPEAYIGNYLDIPKHLRSIFSIGQMFGISSEDRILEVGSGIGTKCLLGNAIWGAHFTGIEPCRGTYQSLRDAILEFKITNKNVSYTWINTPSENTGLPPQSFDLVFSFEVIEHVQEPREVISEMYRLLKPNGNIFISTCNYNSFFEGHYEILWFPFFRYSRSLRMLWIKLHNLNPTFLEEINYVTRTRLVNHLRSTGFKDIEFGFEMSPGSLPHLSLEAPSDFQIESLSSYHSGIRRIIENRIVHNLLSRFGLEYKLYVRARKV